jgi:phage FluMu protein Com
MKTRFRCKKCGASLSVEGPSTGAKVIVRPVTCPKCQEVNGVRWPAEGKYEVRVET